MTELTMQVERSIAAPREAVFRAWLDPEMLRRFMLPGQDMTVPRADVGIHQCFLLFLSDLTGLKH